MKIYKNLVKIGQVLPKKPFFTKKRFIQNYILRYNLGQNEARDMKFGEYMQKKITKTYKKRNF